MHPFPADFVEQGVSFRNWKRKRKQVLAFVPEVKGKLTETIILIRFVTSTSYI